jgi:hypothetical protein
LVDFGISQEPLFGAALFLLFYRSSGRQPALISLLKKPIKLTRDATRPEIE